jgi:hypothetical protein
MYLKNKIDLMEDYIKQVKESKIFKRNLKYTNQLGLVDNFVFDIYKDLDESLGRFWRAYANIKIYEENITVEDLPDRWIDDEKLKLVKGKLDEMNKKEEELKKQEEEKIKKEEALNFVNKFSQVLL